MGKLRAAGALVLMMACALIFVSLHFTSELLGRWQSLAHLPESVEYNATLSHSLRERALAGKKRLGPDSGLIQPIDEALALCEAVNREKQFTTVRLLDDSPVRSKVAELSKQLQLFHDLTARGLNQTSASPTAELEQSYKAAFQEIIELCKGIRPALDELNTRQRNVLLGLSVASQTILFVLFSVLIFLILRELTVANRQRADLSKFSLVANKTNHAVLIMNAEGGIQWVNGAFSRLTGQNLSEVFGKLPGAVLMGNSHNPRTVQSLRTGFAAQKTFAVEMLCSHKSGQRSWLSLSITPVFNEREELINFIGVGENITLRKRGEEEVARVNRRNELLLNAAGEGIFGLDLPGNITFVNPAAARLTGWAPQELIGKPVSTILDQLKVDKLPGLQDDHFTAAAFKDSNVVIGEMDHFRRKEGGSFPVEYTSTAIQEADRLVGTVVVFRDITDRKQAEMLRTRQGRQFALRADVGFTLGASDSLRNILQRCTQAMVKHLDGAFARIWTLNAEEDVLELQASAGLYTHLDGHHSRIPVGTLKVGLIAKGGLPELTNNLANDSNVGDRDWVKREGMVAFIGYPLFVESRLVGVMAMFSRNRLPDDTLELLGSIADSIAQGIVRKRVEEKVTEQAALLDKSQDAIVVTDLSSRCIYWNKSAERLYGWTAKEVYGRKADGLIYRDTSYFDRAKKEVLEKGEWKEECCHATKGDESVIVESRWTLVQEDDGTPKSILIVNTDISERKKIEAQFLRTQRMESIGTLAGGIAHDLNNVLAPILMSVEILKEKFKDDQSRRMLSILESSAKRGASMVKQVLTFARGVEGERVLLQTKHLLKEVAKIVSETFPKTIQLRTNIAENLWTVQGDATQLHQVLVNLAVNARDAMPQGGILTITAENTALEKIPEQKNFDAKPGFYVVIKVADSGTGIPREILDKIFEPFFTTKEMGKGTGLGLSTVLGIVKSHSGFVQVQTEVNKGTQFLIYLPALENMQSQQAEMEQKQFPSGHGELILAVDDEAAVLSMTKETLESYGYRVLTANDGTEAIAAYTAHRHEIKGVLTDMLMPYMDGPSTIRVLKKLDPDLKIIAASGLMDGEKVKDATGLDNIAFLMKPFTAEKLLDTVHKVITS